MSNLLGNAQLLSEGAEIKSRLAVLSTVILSPRCYLAMPGDFFCCCYHWTEGAAGIWPGRNASKYPTMQSTASPQRSIWPRRSTATRLTNVVLE